MSGDNPFDMRSAGERTVIRPNPGQRLGPARPNAPPPGAPAGSDEWITGARQPGPGAPLPRAEDLRFDELAAPSDNPIMRAAGPLLLLLGRLRVAMVQVSLASLMEQVAAAVAFFEKDLKTAGVPPEQVNTAKYLLCATADDIVQNIPTDDRHVWTQYSMLSRFFGERIGGVRFFEELDRLKSEPAANFDVLELQHACLALGFQGVHRTSSGGTSQLQLIQRNLYETLRRIRPKSPRELSPRWQGQALAARSSRVRVPVWAAAGVAALGLFALFVGLRTTLADASERTAQANLALMPNTPITLQRRLPAPPPPPPAQALTQLQRIRAGLGPGVAGCALGADLAGRWIAIRVCSGIMFESGQATVLPQFQPVARRIAETLEKETGPVLIVGHTDNQPLAPTNRFKSNQQLSVERARAAAALMAGALSNPSRLSTEGRGPDEPVADNTSPESRARNRRVEFLVTRTD